MRGGICRALSISIIYTLCIVHRTGIRLLILQYRQYLDILQLLRKQLRIEPDTSSSTVHDATFVPNRSCGQKPITVLFYPLPRTQSNLNTLPIRYVRVRRYSNWIPVQVHYTQCNLYRHECLLSQSAKNVLVCTYMYISSYANSQFL